MSKLVIVESPAKANTIKKYLGKDYDVVASKGHIRDLPAAKLSVDVKNNFAPKYALIKGKEKLVKELKEKVDKLPADTTHNVVDDKKDSNPSAEKSDMQKFIDAGNSAQALFDSLP